MGDFEVRGSHQLKELADRLKAQGRGDLRKELLRDIRTSGLKTLPAIRISARRLPKHGGLADRVANQAYSVQTRLSGASASVRLVGKGMKELADIDRGRLRHPVWNHRDRWVQQSVAPGFFTDAVRRRAPSIRRDIEKSMGDIARKVTGGFLG